MALSNLAVFSEFVYDAYTEVLTQQIDLFNAATNGAIQLSLASNNIGDYSDKAFWGRISGLVKRRNAYASGAVSAKVLTQLVDTMVKVAAATPPVELNPGMLKWIGESPESAAASLGKQLSKDMLADMLNTSISAAYAAIANISALKYDGTGDTPNTLDFIKLNKGQALFGDAAGNLACWVLHSKPMFDMFGNALLNAQQLFKYGDVNVTADPFGRPFVITDSPGLVLVGTPNTYHSLGLAQGAIIIEQNDNEFTDNYDTRNGDENILRTYQAEWTYNMGIKGFTWDKTNGGHSPTDSALTTATNWDKIATSNKDLAGVVVESR